MKRHGGLWADLVSFPNLLRAFENAARGKRGQAPAARFSFHLERELCSLQDELRARTYTPGPYRSFTIREPKTRLISAAPFRDRVVHHALYNVLAPIFEPTFVPDSYACRKGKERTRPWTASPTSPAGAAIFFIVTYRSIFRPSITRSSKGWFAAR